MSILRDALTYLVGLGKESAEVKLIPLPGGKVLVADRGENRELSVDPNCKRDVVYTLSDLVKWIEQYAEESTEPDVFVSERHITVLTSRDRKHAMESCKLNLVDSKAYANLRAIITLGANGASPSQKQFVKALRGPLAGCVEPRVLDVFKRLDFSRLSRSNIEHDSLGKSVEAKAQSSAGEIPEVITFTLPIYDLDSATTASVIRCAVDLDHDRQLIELTPVGDCVEQALRMAREHIADYLSNAVGGGVSVFCGQSREEV